jgi:ribosomal protein S18 acetylase RimI-like enzyme
MDIRSLVPPCWPQLAPLMKASREEGFFFLSRLEHEYLSRQVRFDGAGEMLLGAFQGSAIVGIAGLTRDPYDNDQRTGCVRHVYVLPQCRRRGIGKSLLTDIERHGKTHFTVLVLRTDTLAAANFYQRIGYEQLAPGETATHRRLLTL